MMMIVILVYFVQREALFIPLRDPSGVAVTRQLKGDPGGGRESLRRSKLKNIGINLDLVVVKGFYVFRLQQAETKEEQ